MSARQGKWLHPLRGHHARLLRLFDGLIAEAKKDDRSKLREMWTTFEGALLAHLAAEDAELLPAYSTVDPNDADALARDHVFFRRVLSEFGVDLDLHLVKTNAVEAFVRRLREHAASEDRKLYPWAKRSLSAAALQRFQRLADGLPLPPHADAVGGPGVGLP